MKLQIKSNDPLMRILVRGLFNFIDLIEKRNQTYISPELLHTCCFFHSKPWSRFSFSRLVVQNLSNHFFTSSQLNEILNLNDGKLRFSWLNMSNMSMRFFIKVCLTCLNWKFWNLKIINLITEFWNWTILLCSVLSRFRTALYWILSFIWSHSQISLIPGHQGNEFF